MLYNNKPIDKIENEDNIIDKQSKSNFVKGNRVYILGDFDKTISQNVIPNIVELIDGAHFMKEPEIEIYINSCGGYSCELLGLLSILELAKKRGVKIITYNIGYAYSCGSILSVIGDRRYMYRYADNLPHLGQIFLTPQTVEQLERGTKHAVDWFSVIYEIYSKYTKIPKKELIKTLKDDDFHMNAEECLKYGFCDEII